MDSRALAAKEHLRQALRLSAVSARQRAESARLRAAIASLRSPDLAAPPSDGGAHDGFTAAVCRLVDLEREAARAAIDADCRRAAIVSEIASLPDPLHIDILTRRYIDGEGFYEIAAALSYSRSGVCYAHDLALLSFAETVLGL